MGDGDGTSQTDSAVKAGALCEDALRSLRTTFEQTWRSPAAGVRAVAARSAAIDALLGTLWQTLALSEPALRTGIALVAVGGYGRGELFPHSDVDLMFLLDAKLVARPLKEAIRKLNQQLWDAGLRVSPLTRTLAECERFDPENVEFTLSLLDARPLAGDPALGRLLVDKVVPRLIERDARRITARLLAVTRHRHARYGNTLFHLEPNLKECPGGLRDANVCAWLRRLAPDNTPVDTPIDTSDNTPPADPVPDHEPNPAFEFTGAREFLTLVRCFLHLRHGRDDNLLDWGSQDAAAAAGLGLEQAGADPAYWMRLYFRQARVVERQVTRAMDQAAPAPTHTVAKVAAFARRRLLMVPAPVGFVLRAGRFELAEAGPGADPAHNSDSVLDLFAAMAETGERLSPATEQRLEQALPRLSSHLEDGPALWRRLKAILTGAYAGRALRGMHALGLLELVLPEFHGIDALVIRDAYHRYTVDEHTFVLIDTLHALPRAQAGGKTSVAEIAGTRRMAMPGLDLWSARFGDLLRDLPHPSLLYLAALLHDTGKGHAGPGHAAESARMARSVMLRLEIDPYEAGLVLDLIRNHLEMSAALRRDVFDAETVRAFAGRVATPEALRMLTLFTYADIAAVHPDALTPWKAENLWNLSIATANFLDRNVDDERIAAGTDARSGEALHRIHALLPGRQAEVTRFLEGFPRRYLETRTPEEICAHFELATGSADQAGTRQTDRIDFAYAPGLSQVTLVSRDRPMLFATIAGALAAWGMNIVTADGFSNAHGIVVDSFRFTDTFRTLELNQSERARFVASLGDVMGGRVSLEPMLLARRRAPQPAAKTAVQTRIDFDHAASAHSTLLQVVAQDTPGLLRALALTISQHGCNIEVALVDTEGEMAIDVFYLSRAGGKLDPAQEAPLRRSLLEAIEINAL